MESVKPRGGFFGAASRVWNRLTTPQQIDGWAVPVGGARIPGVRLSDWRQALQVPAVYRCVELVSNSIAMLPWDVHKDEGDGKRSRQPRNPVHWLLHDEPNNEMTAFVFKKTIVAHALGQGNGYAEIERNKRGAPIALHLIDDPDRVTPGRLRSTGEVVYEVRQSGGDTVTIPAADMFHVHGLAVDGINGLGVLDVGARSIAVNIALDKVSEKYFTQGMRTPGFLKMKSGPSGLASFKEIMKVIREEFTGLNNFELPIPIDKDSEFVPAGSNLHDAQFLDLRKFGVLDVCRWFGVPPHLVYDLERATFSNIEAQDLTFLQYGLLPRIVPMEQEANRKLLSHRHGGLYSKMNVNAFARGDMAARIAYYKGMRDMGVYSVNDILKKEDESTIGPEGDVRTQQEQYKPIGEKTPSGANAPGDDDQEEVDPPPPPRKAKRSHAHVNGAGH